MVRAFLQPSSKWVSKILYCYCTLADTQLERLRALNLTAPDEAANTQAVNTTVDDNDDNDNEVDNGPTNVEAHVELAKTLRESLSTCHCQTTLKYGLERKRAHTIAALAIELSIPHLSNLLRRFLFGQLNPNDPHDPSEVPLAYCPHFDDKISVFNSACSRFFAPSDLSGIGGMRREYIRACPIWRNKHPRFDCVFVNTNADLNGMRGMSVARVLTFFSFTYKQELY